MIPGSFEQLGRRPFSFYPAIVGIQHNEWVVRRVTWTEIEVTNTKTFEDLLIPRRFLGEIAAIEEPFLIVGLVKELEYKTGVVVPHQRRVIEMPRAVNGGTASTASVPMGIGPAPVIAIRVDIGLHAPASKRFLSWIVAGILACVIAAELLIALGGHRKSGRDTRPLRPVQPASTATIRAW